MLRVHIRDTTPLTFDDGTPVRAASAIAPFGDGWLIAQDDETIAAWWQGSSVRRVRVYPPVEGRDSFTEAEGTKELKPDIEAACAVQVDGESGVLLLGSGSLPDRMRAALLTPDSVDDPTTTDLTALYQRITQALDLQPKELNLEGACVLDDTLRWFQRGHGSTGVPSSSVDLPLGDVLAAVQGRCRADAVPVGAVRRYEFESSGDVALAITDAALLPDGRILVSAAAEDAPDAVADGEVVGAALAMLDDHEVVEVVAMPQAEDGAPYKVEGLALRGADGNRLDVLGVVDADNPQAASLALELDVTVS